MFNFNIYGTEGKIQLLLKSLSDSSVYSIFRAGQEGHPVTNIPMDTQLPYGD